MVVLNTGLSNIDSIVRAFEECGGSPSVADSPADLRKAARIVLPGVGSFADAVARIRQTGMDEALREAVVSNSTPFLGICLGMQLIADFGTEGGETPGLGLVRAKVERLVPTLTDRRVPHVGWNEVHPLPGATLFTGVPPGTDFYFVHSFHLACQEKSDVAAVTPYCGGFTSAIARDHIFGVQFHPEKSQRAGFIVLSNFLVC